MTAWCTMEGATWYYNAWEYSFRVKTDICSISSIFQCRALLRVRPHLGEIDGLADLIKHMAKVAPRLHGLRDGPHHQHFRRHDRVVLGPTFVMVMA